MVVVRVVLFALGAVVVFATFASAVRTVVIPRAIPARLTRFVFLGMRTLFRLRARPRHAYERRDRVMALYAPVSLLVLLVVWMTLVLGGSYTDEFGRFAAGDVAELDGAVEHRPIGGGDAECVCLLVTEGRILVRGVVGTAARAFSDL